MTPTEQAKTMSMVERVARAMCRARLRRMWTQLPESSIDGGGVMWQVWPFAQQEPAVSSSCHICGAAHAKGNVASWSMSGQWTCTDCEGYRAELAAKAQPSAEERLRRREEYFRKNPA